MVVVASGVSGLTVVFARRNAKKPTKMIATPAVQNIRANAKRDGSAMVNAE